MTAKRITLSAALDKLFSLPNWEHRGPEWKDIDEALRELHAAYKAESLTPPGELGRAIDAEWLTKYRERAADALESADPRKGYPVIVWPNDLAILLAAYDAQRAPAAALPHGPFAVMAGAPWNVLDSRGCRIACCGGDSNADHERHGPAIAAAIVEALNARPAPPQSPEVFEVDGRRCCIVQEDGAWRIYADATRRDLMLNDEGRWESYRGQRKCWPDRADAVQFLRSLQTRGETK